MDIKYIKDKVCPTCGERVVSESIRSYHCNGQGFESRTFKCGCLIEWSPNGGRIEIRSPCPESKEMKEKKARIESATMEILKVIKNLNLTNEEKKKFLYFLPAEYCSFSKALDILGIES